LEKPQQFMLNAVQEYVAQIYNVGESQANNIKLISETVLKYYPKHVASLSDLGLAYTLKNDPDNALKYFLKATAIDPKDFIVLNNIANIYSKKGDDDNALKYYELTQKYGDEEAKALASSEIKRLKDKKPTPKAVMPKSSTTTAKTATATKTTSAKTTTKSSAAAKTTTAKKTTTAAKSGNSKSTSSKTTATKKASTNKKPSK
jgi:tetratricopeptide (TPR) repeat protein